MTDTKTPKHEPEIQEPAKKEDEVEKLTKERDEYKNLYLRALADYRNFEKHAREERALYGSNIEARLIQRLLPFLDNVEKAEIFIKDQGLQFIKNDFFKILSELGVKRMELKGKEYDPVYAEAIETVPGEKDGVIVEIVRNGYLYKDKILQVAQVKVSKKL